VLCAFDRDMARHYHDAARRLHLPIVTGTIH
jgi:hypothetical protein